jgi:hypothetical protein
LLGQLSTPRAAVSVAVNARVIALARTLRSAPRPAVGRSRASNPRGRRSQQAATQRLARLAPPAVLALEELLPHSSPPDVRLRTARYILRLTGVDQRRNNPHARSNTPGPKTNPPLELAASPHAEIEALLGRLLELEDGQ